MTVDRRDKDVHFDPIPPFYADAESVRPANRLNRGPGRLGVHAVPDLTPRLSDMVDRHRFELRGLQYNRVPDLLAAAEVFPGTMGPHKPADLVVHDEEGVSRAMRALLAAVARRRTQSLSERYDPS